MLPCMIYYYILLTEQFYDPLRSLSASQVFNQAALQAKSTRELMDAVAGFMDCSIVIPPTEIQNEAMLNSIISFQKKLLQDRCQSSESKLRRESRLRRGEGVGTHKNRPVICLVSGSIHIRFKLCSPSFHCLWATTRRPPGSYWSTIWRDDSRHKETLQALQE